MKKVIGGKVYNTETARLLAEDSSGGSRRDFGYYEEELYLTKSGRYFLLGSGGPMSRWAVSAGQNSWSGSSDTIEPITKKEALYWLEEAGETDLIMELFGDEIEEA